MWRLDGDADDIISHLWALLLVLVVTEVATTLVISAYS